jgi:hypothetical protein
VYSIDEVSTLSTRCGVRKREREREPRTFVVQALSRHRITASHRLKRLLLLAQRFTLRRRDRRALRGKHRVERSDP